MFRKNIYLVIFIFYGFFYFSKNNAFNKLKNESLSFNSSDFSIKKLPYFFKKNSKELLFLLTTIFFLLNYRKNKTQINQLQKDANDQKDKLELQINQLKNYKQIEENKLKLEIDQLQKDANEQKDKLELQINQLKNYKQIEENKLKLEIDQLQKDANEQKDKLELQINQLKNYKQIEENKLKLEIDQLQKDANEQKDKLELIKNKLNIENKKNKDLKNKNDSLIIRSDKNTLKIEQLHGEIDRLTKYDNKIDIRNCEVKILSEVKSLSDKIKIEDPENIEDLTSQVNENKKVLSVIDNNDNLKAILKIIEEINVYRIYLLLGSKIEALNKIEELNKLLVINNLLKCYLEGLFKIVNDISVNIRVGIFKIEVQ